MILSSSRSTSLLTLPQTPGDYIAFTFYGGVCVETAVDVPRLSSLVYKAVQMPQYAHFLQDAKAEEKGMPEPGK